MTFAEAMRVHKREIRRLGKGETYRELGQAAVLKSHQDGLGYKSCGDKACCS